MHTEKEREKRDFCVTLATHYWKQCAVSRPSVVPACHFAGALLSRFTDMHHDKTKRFVELILPNSLCFQFWNGNIVFVRCYIYFVITKWFRFGRTAIITLSNRQQQKSQSHSKLDSFKGIRHCPLCISFILK